MIMISNHFNFQIGELAMIPSKDVKELLYKLFAERFIALQVKKNCLLIIFKRQSDLFS